MKTVIDRIEQRKRVVAAHPFYRWLADSEVPLARRFDFSPALVNFIMAFSDMNKWFMRYASPTNDYERTINRHTREDETHSRLFVEDWRKLGLDRRLGWGAGETLAWYHAAPETDAFREHGMRILEMLTCNEDPLVRFALIESIEAWGHVMFSASAGVAEALTGASGQEYRYFGAYHLKRELGHLLAGGKLFEDAVLDDDRRARALALVDRFFAIAEDESDRLLRYARSVVEAGGRPTPPTIAAPPRAPVAGAPPRVSAGPLAAGADRVQRKLDERRRGAATHPLFAWMGAEDGVDPADKLRRVALFWAPDCMGYRDLNVHALTYRRPAGPAERAINRRVADLGSHHRLFLRDWAALGMDGRLGFSASDTLDYYCRSERSEVQRESMSAFVRLAFRHPDPVARAWLIEALEASGEAFFAGTRRLAARVEAQQGCSLDYLGDRHHVAHPRRECDPAADAFDLRAVALAPAQVEVVVAMIDVVFDRLDRQLGASLEQATRGGALAA